MKFRILLLLLCLAIANSCVNTNDRDCISVTYNYYKFSKVVSREVKVINNTCFTNNWSNEKYTKIKSRSSDRKVYETLGPPHRIIVKKIKNFSNKKTSCARCYIYSLPHNEKISFNLYALIFMDDQECIKVSCELFSPNWLRDVEEILLRSDSVNYQKNASSRRRACLCVDFPDCATVDQ